MRENKEKIGECAVKTNVIYGDIMQKYRKNKRQHDKKERILQELGDCVMISITLRYEKHEFRRKKQNEDTE